MIILRQNNYSRSKKKENLNFAWEHFNKFIDDSAEAPHSENGIIKTGSGASKDYEKFSEIITSDSGDKTKLHRRKGYLLYPTIRYKYKRNDDDRYPRVYGSSPKTSYKDSYIGFLRNERAMNEERGNIPERFGDYLPKNSPGPTNEDIKNEIRKLAKKEAIKKWGGIALAGGTLAGLTGLAIHKHDKKKRAEKEKEGKGE